MIYIVLIKFHINDNTVNLGLGHGYVIATMPHTNAGVITLRWNKYSITMIFIM